jgi:sodium/potassium-transporting ATPase subunit alpha
MSLVDARELPAAVASLKHRVNVENEARRSESVRSAIVEREDSLEAVLSENSKDGGGLVNLRKSLKGVVASISGSFRESSIHQLNEVMIGGSASQKFGSGKNNAVAPKQNVEQVQHEVNLLKAAKKVADIEIHQSSLAETEAFLRTDLSKGLSSAEAAVRLMLDGPNKLTPPKVMPQWLKLLLHFVDGFQVVLLLCAALSITAGLIARPRDEPSVYLGYVLVSVVFASSIFAYLQESKSDKVMDGFNALTPSRCRVVRDGRTLDCAAEQLVVGDVVDVQFGDKVPADLRIIQASNLKVDNSSLTGEAEPIKRCVDCTHENPMESKNIAFFGTFFVEGSGRAVVFQVGDHTFLGSIASAALFAKQPKSTLKHEVEHFVKTMSAVAIIQGVVVFFISYFALKFTLTESLVLGIGLLVGNVPEGLLPTLTILLTLCARRMKNINVLVKTLDIMETLGCTTCIASDKTGTLTQNKMTVSHVYYGGKIYNSGGSAVSGASYSTFDRNDESFNALRRCATVCNRAVFILQNGEAPNAADIQNTAVHGDASESALIKFCQIIADITAERAKYDIVASIPFNSSNKWQLSIHTTGIASHPHILLIKGAPERIVKMCSHTRVASASSGSSIMHINSAAIETANFELGSRGERVLAFAELPLDAEKYPLGFSFDTDNFNFPITDLHFCGLISLIDPPRDGVADAVLTCQKAGVKVVMVTGDHPVTARAIARSVNIMPGETIEETAARTGQAVRNIDKETVNAIVVPGHALNEFKDEDWSYALSRKQIVFARTMPQQKQDIVSRLQDMGHVVAVTGDGVNDAPALKKADVGVAMGIVGSDVAKESAKVILMDDNFASIVNGIAEGRLIYDNLKKCIIYVLVHITPEFVPFVLFVALQIPLTLQVIMILVIDLGCDMFPAIALAYEGMEGILMEKPPRSTVTDRLASWRLWLMGYVWLGGIETALCFFTFFMILYEYGFIATDLYNSANGFGGTGNLEPFGFIRLALEVDKCSTFCNATVWTASPFWNTSNHRVEEVLCINSGDFALPCYSNCRRLAFFCNMAIHNEVWTQHEVSDPYYAANKDFSNYRVDALSAAQSGYLFTIVLGQIATMMCVKTRFTSLFKRGLDNFYVNLSFPVSLGVVSLIVFAPFCQPFFLTASFNGKYIGYIICMLPIPVLLPASFQPSPSNHDATSPHLCFDPVTHPIISPFFDPNTIQLTSNSVVSHARPLSLSDHVGRAAQVRCLGFVCLLTLTPFCRVWINKYPRGKLAWLTVY